MKLYSFKHSPNPLKVRMALHELSCPFDIVEVNLFKGEQSQPEFAKINPLGKVPVLMDGEITLRESNSILYYLGRKPGSQYWPRELKAESLALQWMFFEGTHMAKPFGDIWFAEIILPKLRGIEPNMEALTAAREDAAWALKFLDQHFSTNPFILGREFSLVDCCYLPTLAMLKTTTMDNRNDFPHVTAYREKLMRRASWKKADGHLLHD